MGRPAASSLSVATPQRLLDAAERAFALTGFAGAKLATIAERAGIRRPSLLYHFKNKRTLYEAVVARVFERLGDTLRRARTSDGDFRTRNRRLLEVYVDFLDAHPDLAKVLLRQVTEGDSPGQEILVEKVSPLLDEVERFMVEEGGDELRDIPVRAALIQLCTNVLVRATAPPGLRAAMWPDDNAWTLAEAVFFKPEDREP